MNTSRKAPGLLDVSYEQVMSLFKSRPNPEGVTKKLLIVVGVLLTPLTAIGALWGYVRSYNRFQRENNEVPTLSNLQPINRVAMILGAVCAWALVFVGVHVLTGLFSVLFSKGMARSPMPFILIGVNAILTLVAMWSFKRWQANILHGLQHVNRFGSARWAKPSELADLEGKQGIYIGGERYAYSKQGHILTVGGTRSGKFVNLLAQHLLGLCGYRGSNFVIDVKGELAAVTARFQRLGQLGHRVLILDPWRMNPMKSARYNPLDLVSNQTNPDFLCDDVSIIAEMIVPKEKGGEQYWNNRARTLIGGIILHLVTSRPKEEHTLGTVWEWLRLSDMLDLLVDMSLSNNKIVVATANEFIGLLKSADRTFAAIISTAQDKTDFLKSPALRASLESSTFDINTLSNGRTTLYVIIPPDQLDAQSQWLRLVFATALQAVVRNRNKRVTFMLDECAALGYLPLLKTAFSTYAGYNVTMWPIFQDLSQIKSLYGDAWETLINNSAVRQFTGVNDEFTSSYLEKIMGNQTVVTQDGFGKEAKPNATARPLATADEIRRGSGKNIFTFIEQRPPTYFPKVPYYEMTALYGRYDDNPYYTPESKEYEEGPEAEKRLQELMQALTPNPEKDQDQNQ